MKPCLQLEIEITRLEPRVWRRILLPETASFFDLHLAIQDLGWDDCHLWQFTTTKGEVLASASPPTRKKGPAADAVSLAHHLPREGSRLLYIYDFGDNWVHEIRSLGIVDHDEGVLRLLLDGAGAFPPEDSGGPWGLAAKLEARALDDDESGWASEWLGDWDPNHFDLAKEKWSFDRRIKPTGS